jgi:hypothetical protein
MLGAALFFGALALQPSDISPAAPLAAAERKSCSTVEAAE